MSPRLKKEQFRINASAGPKVNGKPDLNQLDMNRASDRLKPSPRICEQHITDFERTLQKTARIEEIVPILKDVFGVDQDHIDFLINQSGLEKIRRLWFDIIKFDLDHGVSTSSFIPEALYLQAANDTPDQFAAPNQAAHGVKHRSSLTSVIKSSLEQVRILVRDRTGFDNFSNACFFDLGCGQGKAVIIAASLYDFRKLKGIDYFKPVLNVAKENIKIAKGLNLRRKQGRISFEFFDAAKYSAYNNLNVVYLYNPFDDSVMVDVERNLRECQGKVFVIYNKPLHAEVFLKAGWKVELAANDKETDPDKRVMILSWGYEEPTQQPGYKAQQDRQDYTNPGPKVT